MSREQLKRIEEDGFMACIQGTLQNDCPGFRGSRIQQLRQMRAWLRGWRRAKRIKDAKDTQP